jgi:hypothetical protein
MPLINRTEPLFDSAAPVIAVPANCFGTPEGTLGREVASRFPVAHAAYQAAARGRRLAAGAVIAARDPKGPLLVFVPIRISPTDRVVLDVVEAGIEALRAFCFTNRVDRLALPLLGSGPGALNPIVVRPRIEALLGELSMRVELHG